MKKYPLFLFVFFTTPIALHCMKSGQKTFNFPLGEVKQAVILLKNLDQLTKKTLDVLKKEVSIENITINTPAGSALITFKQKINFYSFVGICKTTFIDIDHWVLEPEQCHAGLIFSYRHIQKQKEKLTQEHNVQSEIIQNLQEENKNLLMLLKGYTEKTIQDMENTSEGVKKCLNLLRKQRQKKRRVRRTSSIVHPLSKSSPSLPMQTVEAASKQIEERDFIK